MQNTPLTHPVSLRLLCVLCAVYLFTGLIGHDLWKYEDAVHIGVAWDMAQGGHWLSPQLAGEAWDRAPLYYWVAASFGQVFGSLIGFHNAARLATAFFGAITLYSLGRTSSLVLANQRMHDGAAWRFEAAAPLRLIGAPGLLIPMHEAQPMIAVLAGHALAYWGLALMQKHWSGGLLLALGLIVTTLAGSHDALLPLAGLALLPLLFASWRNRNVLFGLVTAALLTGGVLAGASALLSLPALAPFKPQFDRDHLELLAWFAWPSLPLALWPLWLYRRQLGHISLPLLGTISALIWYPLFSDSRNLAALPLLIPLALLAATGAGRLRRGAAQALDWFGMMTFSIFGILIWLAEAALITGTPPKLHKNIMRLIPGYENDISVLAWVFAAAISALWLAIIFGSRRSPWRGTTNWACGMVLIWCLAAALWIATIDYGKSYATMNQQIAAKVGDLSCVAGQDLGNAQRAVLHYHIGLITKQGKAGKKCDWLLVQGQPKRAPKVSPGWTKVWNGARPSDREEHYYLFRRGSGDAGK